MDAVAKSKSPVTGALAADDAPKSKPPGAGGGGAGFGGGAGSGVSNEKLVRPPSAGGAFSSSNVKPKSVACAVPRPGTEGGGASTTNDVPKSKPEAAGGGGAAAPE